MSQENHFVAEFYHRLWPWIEHGSSLSFCLDDGGTGGSSTPDLCFCFIGAAQPMRIECKIIYAGKGNNKKRNHIRVYRKQLLTWVKPTAGISPHLWIAKRDDGDEYFLWRHDHADFLAGFEAVASTVDPDDKNDKKGRLVKVPGAITAEPVTLAGLFFRVWTIAIESGLLAERKG